MRLLSWNVNGVRAVQKRGDLDWLWQSDADVVCLQETKIVEEQVTAELRTPPGWRSVFGFGEKKGYSGVATFVRDGLALDVTAMGIGRADLDGEGRVIVTDHGAFLLYNVYLPNGGMGPERQAFKMAYYDAFAAHLRSVVDGGRDVVVCGDFNVAHRAIDVAHPDRWSRVSGFLPEERQWFGALLDAGFVDTFRAEKGDLARQYTWWEMRTDARRENVGWRIDYFVVNDRLEERIRDAWISPQVSGSDHCPIGLELELVAKRAVATQAAAVAVVDEVADADLGAVDEDDVDDDGPLFRRRR